MRKVLVTGVGGDIGQGLIKCLRDAYQDIFLLGFDVDSFAAGRKLVDKFYTAPYVTEPVKYLDFVNDVLKEESVEYIFPVTEMEIKFFDEHREDFGKIKLFINEHDIITTFSDKYKTFEFLKRNNFPCPQTYLMERYADELDYPFILKPCKGCGSKGLSIVYNPDDFDYFRSKYKNYIVQEMIGTDGEEYTVAVFSTGDKTYSIAFRRILGYGSLSKVAHLIHDRELQGIAENIAKAAGLVGSLNMQFRKTDSGYVPFEINPRFSSTVYTRHFFGFQDVKWWLGFVSGEQIEYSPKYTGGVAVRTIGETFFDLHD